MKPVIIFAFAPPMQQARLAADDLFVHSLLECFLVIDEDIVWNLPVAGYMVIVMNMQYFEGKEHRYVDYLVWTSCG
ncbi:hypothetical protein BJ138DRAFT_1113398 [Hygrophoropsis aurantiaca]|uniref:Uncharacterized protein n=1 Tax=Hygrophoropsis aurantiaca TaxID=72124 RepID=A0ACB8ACP6_9AGAM|nr:hypothetical protein BJ138DRAFT_1113398 [Hygrophoropsis aurantiaca]